MRALALLLLVAGCHDLPDLGVCGNGIVEASLGESCDDPGGPTCNEACELKCVAEAEAPTGWSSVLNHTGSTRYCPDPTYACGVDEICRAPSNQLAPPTTPYFFDVDVAPVAVDVDFNGIDDLVGANASLIETRFGGADGTAFATGTDQLAPSTSGPILVFERAVMRATGESAATIAAVSSGVSFLISDGTEFVPGVTLDYPIKLETEDFVFIVQDHQHSPQAPATQDVPLGDVVMYADNIIDSAMTGVHRLFLGSPDMTSIVVVPPLFVPTCVTDFSSAWSTTAVLADAGRDDFRVVLSNHTTHQSAVCQYTQTLSAGETLWTATRLDLPIDVDGAAEASITAPTGACRDLVLSASDALYLLPGTSIAQGCGFGTLVTPAISVPGGQVLTAGPFRGDTAADLVVTSSGVFELATPSRWQRTLEVEQGVAWDGAAAADVTGDGIADAVASFKGGDDVDIIRGGEVLNAYRVDTLSHPDQLLAGDYDGDHIGDVALVEHGAERSRVSVVYGTRDGALAVPQTVAGTDGHLVAVRLHAFGWSPSRQSNDGIDDLALAVHETGDPLDKYFAGFLIGDPRRVPTTPTYPNGINPATAFRDVAVVQETATPTDGARAVMVDQAGRLFEFEVPSNPGDEPPPQNLDWRAPLAAIPAIDPTAFLATHGRSVVLAHIEGLKAAAHPVFCTSDPLKPAPSNEEDAASVVPIRYRTIVLAAAPTMDEPDPAESTYVAAYYRVGLDLPSISIVELGHCEGDHLTASVLFELPGCTDIVRVSKRTYATCHAEVGGGWELVTVDKAGVLRRLRKLEGTPQFLTAGDFDGDGLPDLAATVTFGGSSAVGLYRQCSKADPRDCTVSGH